MRKVFSFQWSVVSFALQRHSAIADNWLLITDNNMSGDMSC